MNFSKPSNLSSLFLDKYRRHSKEGETLGSPENSLKDEENREEDSRVFKKKLQRSIFLKKRPKKRREKGEKRINKYRN